MSLTKRSISLLLALILMLSAFSAATLTASAEDAETPDYTYTVLSDSTAKITGCSSAIAQGDVVIPSVIDNYTVTAIGDKAFYDKKRITSITIPDTVTSIGTAAFQFCTGAVKITIPDSVTEIKVRAFDYCNHVISFVIPDSVRTIGTYAFSRCDKLEQLTVGSSVAELKEGVFYNCSSLSKVNLSNGLKTIGYGAFYNCTGLSEITVPESVTTIGKQAFHGCTSLEKIFIPATVTDIHDMAFEDCELLTIEGTVDSAAYLFAQDHDISFLNKDYVRVESVAISQTSATLTKGSELKLSAEAQPENAEFRDLSWQSSDPSVAPVSGDGSVYGKSAGTATITAAASNGIFASCTVTVTSSGAEAASSMLPTANNNLVRSLRRNTYMTATRDGYMRLFYDGSNVCIEYLTEQFNLKSRKTIEPELPVWGGFYESADAYYLIEGQNNKDCVDGAEVVRIIKYSKNWERLNSGSIYADSTRKPANGWKEYEIRYPFDYGCVNTTEVNSKLYIATGREGYVDSQVGQGHQGMMLLRVDTATMESEVYTGDFSHSFSQYIGSLGNNVYLLEESEGTYCTSLTRYDVRREGGYFGPKTRVPVLKYGGKRTSSWAVPTYASVNDIAVTPQKILGIGTSIDQTQYDSLTSETPINIYLTVTPTDDFSEEASKIVWLTDSEPSTTFSHLHLSKINDDRFLVMWQEWRCEETDKPIDLNDPMSVYTLHYLFVDSDGNKISEEFTADAALSQCEPLVDGSRVVLCSSGTNAVDFYTIDAYTGAFSKKVYRTAGENITWEIKDGTLSLTGNGPITISPDTFFVHPLETTGSYSYYPRNGWYKLSNAVDNIVIGDGVTAVPEKCFSQFRNRLTVTIPGTVDKIEDKAFDYSFNLTDFYVFGDVKDISADALYQYNVPTFHCYKGTNIEKFAKDNGYPIRYLDDEVRKVSGMISSFLSDTDPVQVDLIQNGAVMHSVTVKGNSASYSLDKVLSGSYTLRVSKKNHVTREYTLTVNSKNITQNAQINPIGDVNLNGKVQSNDAMLVYKHAQGKAEDQLTGYAAQCADVNNNSKIQSNDAMSIYKQAQGGHSLW